MKRAKFLAMVVGSFAMLGLALSPVPALATSILDFSLVVPTSGTISYAGGGAPLVGTALDVDKVVGIGTPSNNGVTELCSGSCTLNFTTGPHTGAAWNWGGPGTITLTGTFGAASGVELTGTFSAAEVDPTGSTTFKVAIASFFDTKNPVLTGFYGLPSSPYAGNFSVNFNLALPTAAPAPFSSSAVLSGDVFNSIPEASSLILLGFGLLSLAFWGRKKFKGVN
jgi:hypothetical protein